MYLYDGVYSMTFKEPMNLFSSNTVKLVKIKYKQHVLCFFGFYLCLLLLLKESFKGGTSLLVPSIFRGTQSIYACYMHFFYALEENMNIFHIWGRLNNFVSWWISTLTI